MKRILVLCVLICASSVLFAQELKFKKFNKDLKMTDAVQNPKKDANGVNCGLIKLGLNIPDAEFEGDIISAEYSKGEWLIYMINGANWITIKTQHYLPLRLDLNPPIESNVTYVMDVEIPLNDSTDYYLEQARQAYAQNDMGKFFECIEKVPKEKVPSDLLKKYNNALSAKEQRELEEQARRAYARNNMENFIKYIEEIPIEKVPDDLLEAYENALLDKEKEELINDLKFRTSNFTTIPNKETFELCRTYITKYYKRNSEYDKKVSDLLSSQGKQFILGANTSVSGRKTSSNNSVTKPSSQKSTQGQNGRSYSSPSRSSSSSYSTSSRSSHSSSSSSSSHNASSHKQDPQEASIKSLAQKEKHEDPFFSVGIGLEPFLFIPEDYEDFDIEECGIAANAVLRIGRPKSFINGMLGIGASTGSEIESKLHALSELRINFEGDDDGNYFLGVGAEIPLSYFSSTSGNNETYEELCLKIMAGYRKKKVEFNIGSRLWDDSIGGVGYIGFRWFLF